MSGVCREPVISSLHRVAKSVVKNYSAWFTFLITNNNNFIQQTHISRKLGKKNHVKH